MQEKSVQWRRIFADGTAIVLSILLAFSIDAWWNESQDRTEEREILMGLADELALNHELLAANGRTITTAQDRLRSFVLLTDAGAAAMPADSVWEVVVTPLMRAYTAEIVSGSLDATLSSGKLDLIEDPTLRAALAQIETLDANVAELRRELSTVSTDAGMALLRYASLRAGIASGVGERERLPLPNDIFSILHGDNELNAYATNKIRYWTGYLLEVERLADHLASTAAQIESALAA